MIELCLEKNNQEHEILISKYNGLLYRNLEQILDFYRYFEEVLFEKDEGVNIIIGNKKITSKDFILINLLDVQSILDNLKYSKGNLLYEYSNIIIENFDIELNVEISNYLEEKLNIIKKEFCFDSHLSFDTSIIKLFSNFAQFKPLISTEKINEKIEKMLNYVLIHNINKIFIIFINSDLININVNNNDNVYIFDISFNQNIMKYNILFTNEIINLDYELLMNSIKLNWPTVYQENQIKHSVESYFKHYYHCNNFISNDKNILIINAILNKLYGLKQKVEYDSIQIDNTIKSFLDSFK